MSEIPASQRPETKLETLDLAYDLRARITFELEQSFGYSQKILESRVKKLQRQHPDPNLEAAKIVKMEEDFGCWFIEHERERMLTLCQDISTNLRKANTIFPSYMSEFEERRLLLDRARAACSALEDELQFIAESIPADKNRYMQIVLDCETIFNKITAIRKSDNRFLKHIKGRSCNASNFANVNNNGNANYNNASNANGVRPDFSNAQKPGSPVSVTKKEKGGAVLSDRTQ